MRLLFGEKLVLVLAFVYFSIIWLSKTVFASTLVETSCLEKHDNKK